MKATFTVTLPDGTKATRKSERKYTHVVAIFRRQWDGSIQDWTEHFFWDAVAFSASQSLAEKATSRYRKWSGVKEIKVLPIAA